MTKSFVSRIARLSKTRVTFENGRTAKFAPKSPYTKSLAFAVRARRPVLVKTNAGLLTFAGPVWLSGVNRVRRVDRGLLVNLRGRSSALLLPANHARYKELTTLLTSAVRTKRVLAVAQLVGTRSIADAIPSRSERLSGERTEYLRRPPRARMPPTTEAQVKAAMAPLIRKQCAPKRNVHIPAGSQCVPFKYPYNGCNGRATAVCAALEKKGIASGKVFCFPAADSDLVLRTANEPCGTVYWDHHVACVVSIEDAPLVVDPSLSNELMTIPKWTAFMSHAKGAVTQITSARVYGLERIGRDTWRVHFDRRDARAAVELADARATFSEVVDENGAPPYARPLHSC